jgi:hypothetical protein
MHEDLLAKLDEIEAEMKRLGIWRGAENYKLISSPLFDRWLQRSFFPHIRAQIGRDELPSKEQVALLALPHRDSRYPKLATAAHLRDLISQFERLVESRASASPLEKKSLSFLYDMCRSHSVVEPYQPLPLPFPIRTWYSHRL